MKNSKRNNNSGVYDLDTGRQFRSFVEACEELGLDFHKEYDRCRYKSKLARIFKLNTLPQND
jgi:hypothetical protein